MRMTVEARFGLGLVPADLGIVSEGEPMIAVFRIAYHHCPEAYVPLGKKEGIFHRGPKIGGRIEIACPAGPQAEGRGCKFKVGKGYDTGCSSGPLFFRGMGHNYMWRTPADPVKTLFPGGNDTVHMEGLSKRVSPLHQVTHPVDNHPRKAINFLSVVNYQPSHRLGIVPRGGETGNIYQFPEHLTIYRLVLVCTNGPAGAQKMLHLFRSKQPLPPYRRALLGRHGPMRHCAMRAYGHTMPAINAQSLCPIYGSRNGVLIFEFNDLGRTLRNAHSIPSAFGPVYHN
jgi:hypothetical protein